MNSSEKLPRDPAQIFEEIGFTPTSYFSGSDKYPMEVGQPIEAHVFSGKLVDRTRAVVKTGNFNGGSVEEELRYTEQLREMLGSSQDWLVHKVLSSGDGYIVYELVDGKPLAKDFFWDVGQMSTTIRCLGEMDRVMNRTAISPEDTTLGRGWWREQTGHLRGKWMASALEQDLLDRDMAGKTVSYLEEHAAALDDIVRIYRDPNGGHFFMLGDGRTEVVDVDISYRSRHYMKMRYLAWAMLSIPHEVWDKADMDVGGWANEVREVAKLGPETEPTFVVSLVGILWDLAEEAKKIKEELKREGLKLTDEDSRRLNKRLGRIRLRAMDVRGVIEPIIKHDGKR